MFIIICFVCTKGRIVVEEVPVPVLRPCFHCQDHIGILAWLYLYDNLPVVHLHKDHRAKGKSCCRWIVVSSKKRKDAIPLTHFCHANTRGKIVLAPFYNNWIRFVCHNTLTIRPIQLINTLEHFRSTGPERLR